MVIPDPKPSASKRKRGDADKSQIGKRVRTESPDPKPSTSKRKRDDVTDESSQIGKRVRGDEGEDDLDEMMIGLNMNEVDEKVNKIIEDVTKNNTQLRKRCKKLGGDPMESNKCPPNKPYTKMVGNLKCCMNFRNLPTDIRAMFMQQFINKSLSYIKTAG